MTKIDSDSAGYSPKTKQIVPIVESAECAGFLNDVRKERI